MPLHPEPCGLLSLDNFPGKGFRGKLLSKRDAVARSANALPGLLVEGVGSECLLEKQLLIQAAYSSPGYQSIFQGFQTPEHGKWG